MKMRKILITLMAVLLLTGCGETSTSTNSGTEETKTEAVDTAGNETEEVKDSEKAQASEEAEYVGVFGEDVFYSNISSYVGCEFDITMMYDATDTSGQYVFSAVEKSAEGTTVDVFRVTDKTEDKVLAELKNYSILDSLAVKMRVVLNEIVYYEDSSSGEITVEYEVSAKEVTFLPLLTMVAIAQELSAVGVTKAEVILAVGLPFSDFGREKKGLVQYYEQKPVLKYEFEGVKYDITISKVFVFPQCYSAIAQRLCNMKKDYLIVDIGSKTTDVIYIRNGLPVESKSITIERAMVKWIRQIQGGLQIQYGKNIPENEILKVILKQSSSLPKSYIHHIRNGITEQIDALVLELEEREYDLTYTNVIYVGGGAVAVKNFTEHKDNIAYDCDILANAKGYEFLADQMLRKREAT